LVSITLGSLLAIGAVGCGNGDDNATTPPDAAPPSDATVSDAKSDASDAGGDAEHVDGGAAGDASDAGTTTVDAADAHVEDAPSDAPSDG
jgi:hypothetical protein